MPEGLVKAILIILFGLPMLAGILVLVFGAWWLQFLDENEAGHEQADCGR